MDKKKKIAQLIIARFDGKDIDKKFGYYESLVRKGVGGFIVFGGKPKEVHRAIKKLQEAAEIPLFMASDLEQGLGQQIEGGTIFPPAMAIGQAINPENKNDVSLLRKAINIHAHEAKASGINTIFAPVLDVNTNPKNPIICTRAFSDNPRKVTWFGNEFIKGLQRHGIIACGKHFPGHGDTTKDSHRELPVVKADWKRLKNIELYPFSQAIKSGVKMIMVAHLKIPAIDSRFPATLSRKIMTELLRGKMKFEGLVITDAMNMEAITLKEEEACLLALKAGADIILHPSNAEKVIDYLSSRWDEIEGRFEESYLRVMEVKKGLNKIQDSGFGIQDIGTKSSRDLAYALTRKSINIIHKDKNPLFCHAELDSASKNKKTLKQVQGDSFGVSSKQIVVLIIDDDNNKSGTPFVNTLKKRYKKIKTFYVDNKNPLYPPLPRGEVKGGGKILIIAVFSKTSAWKGRSGLSKKLEAILKKAVDVAGYSIVVGFCCPYVLRGLKADAVINAYPDVSGQAQKAVAEILSSP